MKINLFSHRSVITVFILFLCSFTPLEADEKMNPVNPYEYIDNYIDGKLEQLHIPGAALAIVESSGIVHFHGYGEARPDGEQPSLTTPFILGSLTKSFTAMGVMQLVETGKVNLDSPVQKYLPWFETANSDSSAEITVRHLLNQISGLPMLIGMKHLANFDDSPDAIEHRIRELRTYTPSRSPGEAFEYSDVNFNILGLVIEAASGESYSDYIENHIFSPLQMIHSHADFENAKADRMAVGYTMHFGRIKPKPNLPRPVGSVPSGQLISSAGDMARYLSAMLSEGSLDDVSVLSPEGMAELLHPAANAGSMGVDMGDYAMGWFIEDTEGGLRIWHDGMVPDFFAYMLLLPEQNRGLILLTNANHMIVNFSLLNMCEAIADLLTDQPIETEETEGIFRTLHFFLVIPIVQILGITFTLGWVRRWKANPDRRPKKAVLLFAHIIPATIFHLLLIVSAGSLPAMKMVRFAVLFMPDLAGLLLICGGISFVWLGIRTWLIFHTMKMGNESP